MTERVTDARLRGICKHFANGGYCTFTNVEMCSALRELLTLREMAGRVRGAVERTSPEELPGESGAYARGCNDVRKDIVAILGGRPND